MRLKVLAVLVGCVLATSCASVIVEGKKKGVTVYEPAIYVAVGTDSAGKTQSWVFTGPDLKKSYEVYPSTVLAKQDFSVKLSDGMVTELNNNADTTAAWDLIKSLAEKAADAAIAASKPTSSQIVDGDVTGQGIGLYKLSPDGFVKITPTQ